MFIDSASASTSARQGAVVAPGTARSLRPACTGRLTVLGGQAWITGTAAGDVFVGPGEWLAVPAGAHLVIEPASRAAPRAVRFVWTAATPCADAWTRLWRRRPAWLGTAAPAPCAG